MSETQIFKMGGRLKGGGGRGKGWEGDDLDETFIYIEEETIVLGLAVC